jgi:hypothetical protein
LRFFIGQLHANGLPLVMLQIREDTTMNQQIMKRTVAVAVFGAAMLGSVLPSGAAPISPSTTLLKQAASSPGVTEVYYRRHYRGRGYYQRHYRGRGYYRAPGAAIGLGILGAAAGAAAYGAYGPGYYGPGYYAPGYYGSPYPYRRQYYSPY